MRLTFRGGAEALLWIIAALALGSGGARLLRARRYQKRQSTAFERAVRRAASGSPFRTDGSHGLDPEVLGKLEIPRIGLSTVVREGDDAATLRVAIGHVPWTARPGSAGNVALVAHRDGFFRDLGMLRPGDDLRLVTLRGTQVYRVEGSRVVLPESIGVLAPTARPTLTLVTCYPFLWVGPAPRRYVVTAVIVPSGRFRSSTSARAA